MAGKKVYCYTFTDGYRIWCRGMSKQELAYEQLKHGKLLSKKEDI